MIRVLNILALLKKWQKFWLVHWRFRKYMGCFKINLWLADIHYKDNLIMLTRMNCVICDCRVPRSLGAKYKDMPRVGPVSYTHLDVYKRQRLLSSLKHIVESNSHQAILCDLCLAWVMRSVDVSAFRRITLHYSSENYEVVCTLTHSITQLHLTISLSEQSFCLTRGWPHRWKWIYAFLIKSKTPPFSPVTNFTQKIPQSSQGNHYIFWSKYGNQVHTPQRNNLDK